jgi:hypothetical protein
MNAIPDPRDGVAHYESRNDYATRDFVTSILESGGRRIDWLETGWG